MTTIYVALRNICHLTDIQVGLSVNTRAIQVEWKCWILFVSELLQLEPKAKYGEILVYSLCTWKIRVKLFLEV